MEMRDELERNETCADDHGAPADSELDAVTGGTDAATPKLYEAACKGTHIPEVTIELWRTR
jgi:type VI protein secretion system component Hcp